MIYYTMMTAGILIDLLLGPLLPWRYMALLGAAISTSILLGTLVIPESPRWLLLKSRPDEAKAELRRLRGQHADVDDEYKEMERASSSSSCLSISKDIVSQHRYLKPILLANAVSMVYQLSGMTIVLSYLDIILTGAGWNGNLSPPTISLGISQFVATVLSIYVIDIAGKRPILLVNLLILTLTCVLLGCVGYFEHMFDHTIYRWISLVLLFVYLFTSSIGVGPLIPLLSELLPTRLRASMGSLALATSFVVGLELSPSFVFSVYSCSCQKPRISHWKK